MFIDTQASDSLCHLNIDLNVFPTFSHTMEEHLVLVCLAWPVCYLWFQEMCLLWRIMQMSNVKVWAWSNACCCFIHVSSPTCWPNLCALPQSV